jgi:uncharacterized Tic20 family protein
MSVPPESVTPPPPGDPQPQPGSTVSPEERQWAMFAHLSALVGALLTGALGGGWGCFIGPLVIWLVKKDTMPLVNDQAKEALNFNITVAIAAIVSWILIFVLIGFLLLAALFVAWLVFVIIATIKANEGVVYRYPFTLRLIK